MKGEQKGELPPSVGVMFSFHLFLQGSAILAGVGAVATNQYPEPDVYYIAAEGTASARCLLSWSNKDFPRAAARTS